MQARFFAVVMLVYFSITLLPLAALAVLDPHAGGRTTLVLVVGAQVVALSLLARALLLAELPQQDRALNEKWRRWVTHSSAAGILLGAVTTVVCLFLIGSPVTAGLGSVVAVIAPVALVRALDRYADRVATEHPVDRMRADDEDRLAPGAIRGTLRRRAVQGIVAGAVAGTVVAVALAVLVRGDAWAVGAGLALMVIVASFVLGLGSLGLMWPASRRLKALHFGDHVRSKRVREATLRRRTGSLDDEDRALAREWAAAAEPVYLLQLLSQLPMLVGVPGLQTVLLLLEPDDTFRRWFVPVMIVFLVPLEIRAVRQWRAVRAFALAPSDS